ncbi:PPOX class F420-dependent oxidoreductase [Actinomadura rudentiformis]|uniref:PPOX class F420-dependent oxidoreductase n=1 Tax=Actinomadura rudentiformis TaxID=359158 RepID=A0A6H9Z684_9ACTN|nr:PPOX class F420-dependent oxidoreductase [Actinomadura rudentiformis]KAB2350290.1 PPOX class F420-dependent oxidoreductase [Actinomadura rudentiformis]
MAVPLAATARNLIDGKHTAILATTNADGSPQSSVIFVKREGDAVVFSTIRGRLKTRNMERDPRVSLLVSAHTFAYVEIRGTVTITDDPDKALLREMFDRYMDGGEPPPEPGAERVAVRIAADQVHLWPPASS